MSELTDQESKTIALTCGGRSESVEDLIEQFRPLLVRQARRQLSERVQHRIDESDIVQQTCLLAVRNLDQFRGETPDEFIAWLLQIQEHHLVDAFRYHQQAQRRAVSREVAESGPLRRAAGDLTSPSQGAMKRERKELIQAAIERLPDGQQAVMRMRFVDGLSLIEIAEQMGRSETATAGLLKRGLAKLKRLLGDDSLFTS